MGIKLLLDICINIGWIIGGYIGVDVEVFVFGQGYEFFYGQYDNIDIVKKIFFLLFDVLQQIMIEEKVMVKFIFVEGCDFEKDWCCQ